MKIINTKIPDLKIIEPSVFSDDRGYFFESYSYQKLKDLGIDKVFVQDNESKSQKGVLRGLHFQNPPFAQAKLVRVVKGAVLDVAVDIRKNSPTYGQHVCVELSEQNKRMLYIPEGFAHGFLVLENDTIFSYKCSQSYNKESEGSLLWNDETLCIEWGTDHPILSDKDKIAPKFSEFQSQF
ncbi:MAG: dTDP-4-dehydrorhamnose 3,5-epimerase [Bacteroidales bacterium]|jgi:dTDP-4-dehydrorhamnose 3,5-epimerase|nr:dTDP-4-dehydrorhamnose 3,5-epimerase [Bacteroidales bacterium]